jgi:hypothetical protein
LLRASVAIPNRKAQSRLGEDAMCMGIPDIGVRQEIVSKRGDIRNESRKYNAPTEI